MVQPGIDFQEHEFALVLGYYWHVLEKAEEDTQAISSLFQKLLSNLKQKGALESSRLGLVKDDSGELDPSVCVPP